MEITINELWSWQWLNPIGLALAILGTLYLSADFLDKRYIFLKVLTQGVTFGIIVAFFFGLIIILSELFTSLIVFVLSHILTPNSLGNPALEAFYVGLSDILPNGLIDGLALGLIYSILRVYKIKIAGTRVLIRFSMIGISLLFCSFIAFSVLDPLFSSPNSLKEGNSLYLFANVSGDLGGFVFGVVMAEIRTSWRKNVAIWLLLEIIIISIVISMSMMHLWINIPLACSFVIGNALIGFIYGFTLYNSLQPDKIIQRTDAIPNFV